MTLVPARTDRDRAGNCDWEAGPGHRLQRRMPWRRSKRAVVLFETCEDSLTCVYEIGPMPGLVQRIPPTVAGSWQKLTVRTELNHSYMKVSGQFSRRTQKSVGPRGRWILDAWPRQLLRGLGAHTQLVAEQGSGHQVCRADSCDGVSNHRLRPRFYAWARFRHWRSHAVQGARAWRGAWPVPPVSRWSLPGAGTVVLHVRRRWRSW